MQKHGLGNQQAYMALALSYALKARFLNDRNGAVDVEDGLAALTAAVQEIPRHASFVLESPTRDSTNAKVSQLSSFSLPKISSEKSLPKITSDRKPKAKTKLNRKRVIEEEAEATTKRVRADSVSEEVSAKVEEASAAVPAETKVKSTPLTVRNKRSRSAEDSEVHPVPLTANKRRKSTV